MTRVRAISDPGEVSDPSYAEGLRAAVSAAIEHGMAGIEAGERTPPVPPALLAQARLAARNGIGLDAVLRRYFAGYALLGDFLVQEAEGAGMRAGELKGLLRSHAMLLDRLLAAVGEEHGREERCRSGSVERRRAELIEGLLAGELLDGLELAYDLDCWHLGVVASGRGATAAIRTLAQGIDGRLLSVLRPEGTLWAWLGTRVALDPAELKRGLPICEEARLAIALGEPVEGLAGWRLTHRQAAAALPVAHRGTERVVRYADVALLSSALQDEFLAVSLRRLYMAPLEADRDGGEVAKETLRAYFAADRNVSSAGASLKVSRTTVASRLRAVETAIGRSLSDCAGDLETALRLSELGAPGHAPAHIANR